MVLCSYIVMGTEIYNIPQMKLLKMFKRFPSTSLPFYLSSFLDRDRILLSSPFSLNSHCAFWLEILL